jgi:hypothetical protein
MTEAATLTAAGWVTLLIAVLLLLVGLRLRRKIARIVFGILTILTLIVGGVLFWYTHRPLPPEVNETLFQGIVYIRDVRSQPRPLVIHVVRIDLDAPGLRFFVTPGGENIPARTVSQFADEFDVQLAINGDYFAPWYDSFPGDYYPHIGDPVDTHGLAATEGTLFSDGSAPVFNTLYISAENTVSFGAPNSKVYNAISGLPLLVTDGEALVQDENIAYYTGLHPRTAVGLDETKRTLILMLVDGRQPGYSEGVSLDELCDLLLEYGAYDAINFDGGGSVTLVAENADGTIQVLNSPIHRRAPGNERPIANHLGIYAQR